MRRENLVTDAHCTPSWVGVIPRAFRGGEFCLTTALLADETRSEIGMRSDAKLDANLAACIPKTP